MSSILVKVQPILDETKARRMENSLAKRFQKVSKTFAGGLKNAVKFELHCGAIGLFMGALLNPIKDYAEKMDQAPAKASDIATKANQFGQANADYLALQTIAQAKGVNPQTLISILTNLQQKITQARQLSAQGKPNQLSQFKNETNIVDVFVKILSSLNAYGNKEGIAQRIYLQEQIFGQNASEKLDPLFQTNASEKTEKLYPLFQADASEKTEKLYPLLQANALKAQQSTVAKFGQANADYLALQTIAQAKGVNGDITTKANQFGQANADYLALQTIAQAKGINPQTLISILTNLQQKITQARQLSAQGKPNQLSQFKNQTNIVSVLASAKRGYDDYFELGKAITTSSLVTQDKRKASANELTGKKLSNYEMYTKLQETTSKLLLEVASIAALMKPLSGVASWQTDNLPGLAKQIEEFIKNIPIKLDAIKNSFVGKLLGFRDN